MKKYIVYFSLLFVAFATMPTVSFGLDGKNDFAAFRQRQMNQMNAFRAQQEADMEEQQKKGCPIAVNNAADDMWSNKTTNVDNNKYKQSVKDDTASLQQYKTKYNNVINGSETNKLSNVKCPSNQCEVDCNGLTAICKKGALLKDCNKNVYSCFQNSFVKNEYRMYMIKKVCPDIPEREKFIKSFNFDVSKLFKETNELSDADKAAIKAERDFQNSGLVAQVDKNTTETGSVGPAYADEMDTPAETGSVGPAYADADNFDFAAASAAETERKNSTVIKPNSTPKVVEPEEVKNTTPTNSRARASANGKPSGTRSANAKTGTDEETIKSEIKKVQKCTREWSSPTAAVGSECRINKNLITNDKVSAEIEKLKKACTSRKGGKKGISENVDKFKVRERGGDGATVPYKCVIDTCKGKFVPDSFATSCVEETNPEQMDAQYCTESGGKYNNGKCDCGSGRTYYPDRQMCDNAETNETIATANNNCRAEGGTPKENGDCDCRDSRIWNKETQTCEIVTIDEETQILINNCKSDGVWDYTNSTCKCHSSQMAWSKSQLSCVDKSMLSPEERAAIPNSDLEKEMAADIQKLTNAMQSVVKKLTAECVGGGGYVKDYECFDQ